MNINHFMRRCTACLIEKALREFGKDLRSPDACKSKCRPCEKAYNLKWQRANVEHVRKKNAEWARANKDIKRAIDARRDKAANLLRAKRPEAMALARATKRREYERRRDILLPRVKAWAVANRETRRKYASQPHVRLHNNTSRAIRASIQLNKAGRSWESLVGYTRGDLVMHLERQFADGMTWENYGKWEIDHIRPRASFSFARPEDPQFLECWALGNLQPLWMAENRKKGARLARQL